MTDEVEVAGPEVPEPEATRPAEPELASPEAPQPKAAQAVEPACASVAEEPAATAAASAKPTAAVEPAPAASAPEPPAAPVIRRQALALRSGVCDMRVGAGAVERIGQDLRVIVGKPKRAFVVFSSEVSPELVQTVERSLIDIGFAVTCHELAAGRACRNLEAASALYPELASAGITSEDALVAVGDADLISMLLFVASTWCGGCPLAAVPTAFDGIMDVSVTPRSLDCAGSQEALAARGNVRLMICDPTVVSAAAIDEATLMGHAISVAGAVTAGKTSFSDLALRADALLAGDDEAFTSSVMELTKARCRIASSSAVAIRQGVVYGADIARGLKACLREAGAADITDARLLAEGMRISARLAAAHQGPETELVDFVFAQDALLEKFGLAEVPCELEAVRLLEAIRSEMLCRQNRFMLALPLDYGRVRLTPLEDDVLVAHLGAWCKMRRRLKRRLEREAAKQ